MHKELLIFVNSIKNKHPKYFNSASVLEVGSLNINGSVRILFQTNEYIGIDVAEGNGVDIVCEGQDYDAPDNTFDTVISCECFEHNPYWKETFANMIRMCKPNGLIIMTCATIGRPEHGTTEHRPEDSPLTVFKGWNYYKNLTAQDFEQHFIMGDYFSEYAFTEFHSGKQCHDLYFYGFMKTQEEIK